MTTHTDSLKDAATLSTIQDRLDALAADVAYVAARQRKTEELFAEMTPILREVMATATTRLDALEKKGYFAFGKEIARVGERVVEGFSPDDVRQLGDAIVGILRTVRAMTRPEVLQIAAEATEAIQHVDASEPLGLVGMVRATRDDDVRKGMAVLMDLMRHVGRAAGAIAEERRGSPMEQKKKKLAAVTGAKKKKKKVLGVERPAAEVARAPRPAPACAAPNETRQAPREVAATIDGVGFLADGSLADPSTWSRGLAERIAGAEGVGMTPEHWKVVDFARADFEATGSSPNIRRITQSTGMSTKDLYALFPKAPARTAARIAGLPKPAGCI